eukprot:scaffold10926_cov163-Amphora_coffeaeformis.AAC.2
MTYFEGPEAVDYWVFLPQLVGMVPSMSRPSSSLPLDFPVGQKKHGTHLDVLRPEKSGQAIRQSEVPKM